MVQVLDCKERKNAQGEAFVALILCGGLEMVQSKSNGKFYATVRKCSIPSTLDLEGAKNMIGSKMPGKIVKVPCPPYEYTTTENEVISLDFTYEYQAEPSTMVEGIIHG